MVMKAMGVPTIDGYAKHNLALFFAANEVIDEDLECYKLDRVPHLTHLYFRTYAGRAKHRGRLVGLVVFYDEDTGLVMGKTFDPRKSHLHGQVARQYRVGSHTAKSFYSELCFEWAPELEELKKSTDY